MSEFARYLHRLNPSGQAKIVAIATLLRRRKHALFGAHARNAHVPRAPRATVDIDVLVPDALAAARAAAAIHASVPNVSISSNRFGTVRVFNRAGTREKLADIVPANEPIDMAAIATARPTKVPSLGTLRVPPKEIIAAMKLESASDRRRKPIRAQQDEADVGFILDSGYNHAAMRAALALVGRKAKTVYERVRRRLRKTKTNPRWAF